MKDGSTYYIHDLSDRDLCGFRGNPDDERSMDEQLLHVHTTQVMVDSLKLVES